MCFCFLIRNAIHYIFEAGIYKKDFFSFWNTYFCQLECPSCKQIKMQQSIQDPKELFHGIWNDEKEAFNTLFRLYYSNLTRFARQFVGDRGEAEEVVSDVFVWIWNNRTELLLVNNPEVYLFIMTKNRCLNVLRRTNMEQAYNEKDGYESHADDSTPLTDIERQELTQKLHFIIGQLPEQQQQIFRMIKENGLSAKQTAEILQLSPRTVETHIYKAVKRLEEEITSYLGYSPRRKRMKLMLATLV